MSVPKKWLLHVVSFRDSESCHPKLVVPIAELLCRVPELKVGGLLLLQSVESEMSCVVFSIWGFWGCALLVGDFKRPGFMLGPEKRPGWLRLACWNWYFVLLMGPNSFQCCPATGQGAMGTNWSSWRWGRTSSLWGWRSPGPGCPEGLWSLLLWRYSNPAWPRCCAACSGWACLGRGLGWVTPRGHFWPLPCWDPVIKAPL